MTFRNFTPEEEAVLDLIIERREESGRNDDLFIYDVRSGQKKLNSNGNAQKYGIGLPQQHEIIRRLAEDSELAKDCIINADWIIAFDSGGTDYKFARHNDGTWLDKTEKNYEIAPIFFSSKNELENFYYIQLSFEQIKVMHDNYRAKYSCTLSYDDEKCRFVVTRNDTGEKYTIRNSRLKCGFPPFKVLLAAMQSKEKYIERDDIGIDQIKGKSIATQVFDDNSVVRNELAPFVELKPDSIRIHPTTNLSLAQLEYLKGACV